MDKRDEVYNKKVKAGKRTYFFDVKPTRANDYYLTITESKRLLDGFYEKHKIFLYKEDFNKFIRALEEVLTEAKALMPEYDFNRPEKEETESDTPFWEE